MAIRTFEELLGDHAGRIARLERRLPKGGAGGGGGGGTTLIHFPGDVWQVSSGVLPPNTLWADGRAVSRAAYPELFAKLGITYGRGDGSTTFNLPNLNGKQMIVPPNAPLARWNLSNVFTPLAVADDGSVPNAYEIRATMTQAAGSTLLPRVRFSAAGADASTASYVSSRQWLNNAAVQRAFENGVPMFYLGSEAAPRQFLQAFVTQPGHAADYTEFTWDLSERGSPTSPILMTGTGYFAGNVQFDGISLFNEGGSMYGWVEVIPFGGSMVPSVIAVTTVTGAGLPAPGLVQVPALPDPVIKYGPDSQPVNWGAAGWGDIPNANHTFTLPYPMWVQIDFSAQITGSAAAYGMIGVHVSGALTLLPTTDQATGLDPKFGLTPFNTLANSNQHGTKIVLLPKGSSTITLQGRRSTANFTPNVDYSQLTLTPLAWVGAPGAVKSSGGLVGVAPVSVVAQGGGSAVAQGHKVTFNGVSKVSLNGIFDASVAEDYVIECIITGQTQGGWIRLRKNGVDTESAVYGNQQTYNNAAGTLVTAYAATTGWVFIPLVGTHAKFTAKISNAPAAVGAGQTCYLDLEALSQQSGFISNGTNKGTSSGQGYDGFTIATASGTISGWLRVYALT